MRNKNQITVLLIACLFVPVTHIFAQYSGYVGETIRISKPSTSYGDIVNWRNEDPSYITIHESTPSITIERYFSFTCYVLCSVFPPTGRSIDYMYSITCKKTSITGLPKSVDMEIGEKRTLSWSWSPGTARKPKVTWESTNYNVAYVNQYDELEAKGSGKVTITAKNDCGDDVKITVTVKSIPVTEVTIDNSYSVEAEGTKEVSIVSKTPSNGSVKSVEWNSEDKDIATFDSSGKLMGVWPGKTKIWCTVNGTIKSNEAEVTVTEPAFIFSSFSLQNGATSVETQPTVTATFSHALSRGNNFDKIALTDGDGKKVDGTVSINGMTLTIRPSKHLRPLTIHKLTIPAGSLKNKWGTGNSAEQTLTFSTTDWQRMTLSATPGAKFLNPGTEIKLSCSSSGADIYYSTDGSKPTKRYTKPINFAGDMILRAVAQQDGYYDSDEFQKNYLASVEIIEKYPSDEPLYNYADVNPSITYSYPIEAGTSFNDIKMTKDYGESVSCQLIIQGNTLYLVPTESLRNGSLYTVNLPDNAIHVTGRGEQSKAYKWSFATGNYATAISVGGPELGSALKTDGSLWTWGRRLTNANADDGSYSYTAQNAPGRFVDGDVVAISSGYMHHALIKHDGSLWMWGRQLCGEFGNGMREASAQPIKVMDGVRSVACGLQNTAIIKDDGTLWMCGRNDLGQIDDTRTVYTSYKKVANDVGKVQLNWGSLTYEKTDGTIETRTWNEVADNPRAPEEGSIDGATQVEYGWLNAVALGQDGSVWVWDQRNPPQEVIAGRNPQLLEGISLFRETLKMDKGELMILPSKPVPLLADYSTLTWKSDNESVATVSQRGVVTAIADGTTIVTAQIADAYGKVYEATCTVKVGETTGIDNRIADNWQMHVTTGHCCLYVSGVPENQLVLVYSAAGRQVFQGRMVGERMEIAVPVNGIYVIRAAHETKKIAVR